MDFTVSDFLALSELEECRLVAGAAGVDRVITRTNIMDNPDTFDWLMPGEFLLSTGYIFRESEQLQRQIIRSLAEIECAGLCIKVERYLKTIPRCMIEEAEKLGLPLIELPFGYSLSTTIGIINRRLYSESNELTEGTISIHREVMQVALSSGGLSRLAEMLARRIDNPVLMTDNGWNLLCYEDRPNNPYPLERHLKLNRKQQLFSDELIASLPNTLRHYRKAVTRSFITDEGHRIALRILPIAANNEIHGFLVVWESVKILSELDYIAVEQVGVVAALEQIRTMEIEQIKLRARKDFFDDLLAGNIESRNAIRTLSDIHGLSYEGTYRCFVVRYCIDEEAHWQQRLTDRGTYQRNANLVSEIIEETASNHDIRVITLTRGFQVICLALFGTEWSRQIPVIKQMLEQAVKKLKDLFDEQDILISVGNPVTSLAEVHNSYRSAMNGFRIQGSAIHDEGFIIMDDQAVFQLLNENIDKNVLRRFYRTSIGALMDYDQEHDSQLLETLECYFQHNCNITDTAKALFIHRNTCIYRIEKIKALLETDFKNPGKQLEIQLAMLAWRSASPSAL